MTDIVWFKRDLRTHDHKPLFEASLTSLPVLPIYIVEPDLWRQPFTSRRHWHFTHDCISELRKDCFKLGQPLIVRIGEVMEVFNALHSDFCIKNIWAHEETGHIWSYKRDKVVRNWCRSMGVGLMEFPSNSVVRGLKDRGDWQTIRQTRLKKPLIK